MNENIQRKEKELALANNEVHVTSLSYNIVPRHVSFLERDVELLHLPCRYFVLLALVNKND